jgi:hypothetical protein
MILDYMEQNGAASSYQIRNGLRLDLPVVSVIMILRDLETAGRVKSDTMRHGGPPVRYWWVTA